MAEFSRRVDIEIIKDEPIPRDDYLLMHHGRDAELNAAQYDKYLDRFQAYRWRAVAANNEPIAHGESYFNEAGCLNAIALLAGDDTTVYWTRMFGTDRGMNVLRYGATDRASQQ